MLGGGKRPQVGIIQSGPFSQLAPFAELRQDQQIVPIGRNGMTAHAPFAREMRQKSIHPFALGQIHRSRRQRMSA
jgi:hypothetical protein